MNIRIKILLVFSLVLLSSNIFSGYINLMTEGLFKSYKYKSKNGEFKFVAIFEKGRNTQMMERQFEEFKKRNSLPSNSKIYRTFKINPFKFWNWYRYLTNERYKYQYKS